MAAVNGRFAVGTPLVKGNLSGCLRGAIPETVMVLELRMSVLCDTYVSTVTAMAWSGVAMVRSLVVCSRDFWGRHLHPDYRHDCLSGWGRYPSCPHWGPQIFVRIKNASCHTDCMEDGRRPVVVLLSKPPRVHGVTDVGGAILASAI